MAFFFLKVLILAIIVRVSYYNENLHPHFMLVLYYCYLYLGLEIMLILVSTTVQTVFGFEIEPLFKEPYLCTFLQDLWGRRWNLTVTHILRLTVYDPVHRRYTGFVGPLCATSTSMLATFLVSGLMHELILYYLTRAPLTWEVTCFFVLHGGCIVVEVAVKKVMLRRGCRLHRTVSGPLVVAFLAVTGWWLFFPQLLRNGVDRKATEEYEILVNFVVNSTLPYMYESLG